MYKNPSFCSLVSLIRDNTTQHNKERMTLACLISQNGIMMVYNSMEEILSMNFSRVPAPLRATIFAQYLHDTEKYFFHMSYEYTPNQPLSQEADAKRLLWKEALSCAGIKITPANVLDQSNDGFIASSQLISDAKKFEENGEEYYPGAIDFLKTCKEDAMVSRSEYDYNDIAFYCIKLKQDAKTTIDPSITFRDNKKRPAVIRKSLHEFLDTYATYMHEDENFTVFVYPDGTAANMSDGYGDIDIESEIPDEMLENFIRLAGMNNNIQDIDQNDLLCYRLEILRIVCIIGTDCAILPYPITPQQSVFLEGLGEFGHFRIQDANIVQSSTLYHSYDKATAGMRPRKPILPTTFLFEGAPSYFHYDQLSPCMKKKVDSVMNIDATNKDTYLFDATSDERLFVIDHEAEL